MIPINNPKADNQLNLALSATPQEREKSADLNVGYDPTDRQWDLIIKYSGDTDSFLPYITAITPLLNQYAVVRILQSQIDAFIRLPQIEYVEKPKRLFFTSYQAQAVSGINAVKGTPYGLSGKGILMACVDSGIDYRHLDFRNPDGTTRLVALWDQTVGGSPPAGYFLGTEFTKEELDQNLEEIGANEGGRYPLDGNQALLSTDFSGHGTAVMGIAAGNGRESDGIYEGVAPQSDLLVVKLGTPLPDSFPRTTELIQAIDYCVRTAIARNQPLALNLSFGSSYGSREGNSLLETYIDQISNLGRNVICVGMGNEGRAAGHANLSFVRNADQAFRRTNPGNPQTAGETAVGKSGDYTEAVERELAVGGYQTAFSMQLWKNYVDEVEISLFSPAGEMVVLPINGDAGQQTYRYTMGRTQILFYLGGPSPYSLAQEYYFDFLPLDAYVDEGIWRIRAVPKIIVEGDIDLYLPGGGILNENTGFLQPTPERTLTIPAAADQVIAVGAYDSTLNSYANFSGRGYTRETNLVKPDLAAPGVNIQTVKSGGGYASVTGTSFATPFVTGSAALMMEWGIVRGNDPYFYGEVIKANLRKGARRIAGISAWPNPELGYGMLHLFDSIPKSS